MVKTFNLEEFNYKAVVGKFAQQADGAVWFQQGDTVILATVVSSPTKEFPGFLPLTVEYREQFSAAGKIPGGYFKREGKTTDREILIARLIDRAVRPLFPADFFDQVQIIVTVYSVDKEHAPENIALIATSLALTISDVPFLGPVSSVEIGRINGSFVFNPRYSELQKSDAQLTVAGTEEGLSMVEGYGNEMKESDTIDALFKSHDYIKKVVAWQNSIQKEVGKPKNTIEATDGVDWNAWKEKAQTYLTSAILDKLFIEDKVARGELLSEYKKAFVEKYQSEIEEDQVPTKVVEYVYEQELMQKITGRIFELDNRIDLRKFDKIRDISVEVGLLPSVHGSALFKRGRTQALVSVTLGGGQDEQRLESIMKEEENRSFMLHYNFHPFSVGEIKPVRGPGRREIGHGYLARSSFTYLLPTKDEFPYTIRLVSDILESNGSSSMATACGSTMAMMQAGVPLKKMVAGIAMGLLKYKDDYRVLSDITGFEDAFGLMDFKVVGTDVGITAIQLDVKYKGGFTRAVFEKALEQARQGRLHILGEMRKVMSAPSATLSDLVPKVTTIKIDPEKIGAIIGKGGQTIREIIEQTKTTIDVEEDGLVKIFGGPDAFVDKAIGWVKVLAGQIGSGDRFKGKVKRIADFGVFVELVPGVQGLLHISNIPRSQQKNMAQLFKSDDIISVKVLDYDDATGRISLALLEDNKA